MVKLKYNKKKRKWEELPHYSKEGIYFDNYLWNTFKDAKKVMDKKDVDLPICVSGYPGTGKSTFVIQIATVCDPTFNDKRMCQTAEDFIEGVKNSKPGQAWAIDESYKDLNASDIRKEVGRALLNVLNIIRQKRLYIFILLPNYFDLGKNIAIFRTRWLIHCYEESFGNIGYFVAFDRNTKRMLYIKGKRYEDYNCVKGDFFGSFTKKVPDSFNWNAYLKIKQEGLKNVFCKRENVSDAVSQRNRMIYYFNKELEYKPKKIGELFEMKLRNVQLILKESRDNKD